MRPPVFVRPLTDAERAQIEAGLRSSDAFTLRRCQIVLARARHLGCDDQTVREAIRAFDARGMDALRRGSHRPKTVLAGVPETAEAGEKPQLLAITSRVRPPMQGGGSDDGHEGAGVRAPV